MDASQCAALLVSPLKGNELTLCARCYVRRVGIEFKRVELREKETLLLLEAVMHYGDDWKKVAQHVCYW